MRCAVKTGLVVGTACLILVASVAIGSVSLPPGQVLQILLGKISGDLGEIDPNLCSIVWDMRFQERYWHFWRGRHYPPAVR